MRKIKGIRLLCVCVLCMVLFTACEDEKNTLNITRSENGEKVHDDIEAGNISHVNISGNARSVVIKQSENNNFEFYNADLNADHKYEVRCDQSGSLLNISLMMEMPKRIIIFLAPLSFTYPGKNLKKLRVPGNFIKSILTQYTRMYLFTQTNHL